MPLIRPRRKRGDMLGEDTQASSYTPQSSDIYDLSSSSPQGVSSEVASGYRKANPQGGHSAFGKFSQGTDSVDPAKAYEFAENENVKEYKRTAGRRAASNYVLRMPKARKSPRASSAGMRNNSLTLG